MAYGQSVSNFDAPNYTAGQILEGQQGWALKSGNAGSAVVKDSASIKAALDAYGFDSSKPTPDGSGQALAYVGGFSGEATTYYTHQLSGFTSSSVVSASWDIRSGGVSPSDTGTWFVLDDGVNRAVAVRLSTNQTTKTIGVDYYSGGWKSSGVTIDTGSWHHLGVVADYASKTYSLSVDNSLITAKPVAFYSASSTVANEITLFRGGSDAGALWDNINVVPEPKSLLCLAFGFLPVAFRRRSRE